MPERKKLLQGFQSFRKKYYEDSHLMEKLAKEGANPDFFIIHCIDPRSGAGTVFNSDPGAMFGSRVMAALVPPQKDSDELTASLSYAIKHKKIKHLIIMGHTQCGGIKTLVDKASSNNPKPKWLNKAQKAFDRAKTKVSSKDKSALYAETERQTIILGLKNLLSYPDVKKAFEKGDLTLNGWLFDIEHGDVLGYNPGSDKFESLIKLDKGDKKIQLCKDI